ncbi:leucine-rich repeat domain-containing protein [soil metagenome]
MDLGHGEVTAKLRIAEEARLRTGVLRLNDLRLNFLPSEISHLTHLTRLDCKGTAIRDLSPLTNLAALRHLDCASTGVSDLSPLGGLHALEFLSCSDTAVEDLTPLSALKMLSNLECARTRIRDLAPLRLLTRIRYLDCKSSKVNDLSSISALVALRHLDCEHTQISDLGPVSELNALHHLACAHTFVRDLSPVRKLSALRRLSCADGIGDLTPLSGLTNLQYLICRNVQATDLSPLSNLTSLQHLDCSRSQIDNLAPLYGLRALRYLDCSGTNVSNLTPLAAATELRYLNCSQTKVSDLTSLGYLTTLQFLNFSGCDILFFPAEIVFIPSMQSLITFESAVPELPHGLLSTTTDDNCFARMRAHFIDLSTEATNIVDVKLLLLGNGGVGKTQIARWLMGEAFVHDWDSTHGIRITGGPKPNSIAARLNIRIWDFGGQDIYHGTHALFLQSPAVLMPVWAHDRENRDTYEQDGLTFRNHPLAYWVDVIRHQARPGCPVVIVQSKCDRKDLEAARFPLSARQLDTIRHVTEVRVSPKEKRGGGALEEAIREAVDALRRPGSGTLPRIGAGRLRVQRRLEAIQDSEAELSPELRRHQLMTREEFDQICASEGGIYSTDMLLDYLDANGTIFFRPGLFGNRVLLDQGWALNAIYSIFDRKHAYSVLCNDHGRFSRAKLALLVWQKYKDDERQLFIDMMLSCGICFVHRPFVGGDNDAEYIAPDLLPPRKEVSNALASRWFDDRPTQTASLRYRLLHGGLIRAIMAEFGRQAGADAVYWHGGLCAYDVRLRCHMLIEEETTGDWQGSIHAHTQGDGAELLLEQILATISQVQNKLGLQAFEIKRPESHVELDPDQKIHFGQEKPDAPEWYVSYAWGDMLQEGRDREALVDGLCRAAEKHGTVILRDKNILGFGDSISAFMRRIGQGDRIFVILSDKYLRSPFCMFELSEIWRNCCMDKQAFLERVRVFSLPDVNVSTAANRADWAIYWKQQYDALDHRARVHGATILGESGHRELRHMQRFYTDVADILDNFNDIVQPRTLEELEQYGFSD